MQAMKEYMRKKIEKSTSMPFFPEEIVGEILSRLPVKTLLRFKCVCKSWQCLISNPKFKLSPNGRERAILCSSQWIPLATSNGARAFSVEKGRAIYTLDRDLSPQELPCPVGKVSCSEENIQFLGSCRGLLLLSTLGDVYLWNPSTRCCRELPEFSGFVQTSSFKDYRIGSGLCFDESSNDYKIVLIIEKNCYVASLRIQEWTSMSLPYQLSRNKITTSGVLANGHLHWIVEEKTTSDKDFIVYFDEKTDRFNKLPMPELELIYGHHGTKVVYGLGVLDGCLYMSTPGISLEDTVVLVMREYGVKDSWIPLFSLPVDDPRGGVGYQGVEGKGFIGWLAPLLFSRKSDENILDEEVLVANVSYLLAYNPKYNTFKNIELHPYQEIDDGPLMYMESLESVTDNQT